MTGDRVSGSTPSERTPWVALAPWVALLCGGLILAAAAVLFTRPVAPSPTPSGQYYQVCGRLLTVITEFEPLNRYGAGYRRCTEPAQDRLPVALALLVLGVWFVAGALWTLQRRSAYASAVFDTLVVWAVLLAFGGAIGLYWWVDKNFAAISD